MEWFEVLTFTSQFQGSIFYTRQKKKKVSFRIRSLTANRYFSERIWTMKILLVKPILEILSSKR